MADVLTCGVPFIYHLINAGYPISNYRYVKFHIVYPNMFLSYYYNQFYGQKENTFHACNKSVATNLNDCKLLEGLIMEVFYPSVFYHGNG
jgi:hypothetical protein